MNNVSTQYNSCLLLILHLQAYLQHKNCSRAKIIFKTLIWGLYLQFKILYIKVKTSWLKLIWNADRGIQWAKSVALAHNISTCGTHLIATHYTWFSVTNACAHIHVSTKMDWESNPIHTCLKGRRDAHDCHVNKKLLTLVKCKLTGVNFFSRTRQVPPTPAKGTSTVQVLGCVQGNSSNEMAVERWTWQCLTERPSTATLFLLVHYTYPQWSP